jgi:putative addiction module component (TIGR02574 family)
MNCAEIIMTEVVERIKSEVTALPAKERAELAYFLLRSLDDEPEDAGAEAAWDAELARREAEVTNGKVACKPAGQVLSELREKHA